MNRILTIVLVAMLLASTLVFNVNVSAAQDNSVQVLINNAQRLRGIAYEKYTTLTSKINTTLYSANITLIESLLASADTFLNMSVQLYSSGNLTGAKTYAIYAINTYDEAIELIEEVADAAGVAFEEREGVEEHLNETEHIYGVNASNAINRTALLLQLQVLEARISALEASLSKINQSQYNLTLVFQLLSYAKSILATTKDQLATGNLTVSALAKNLAVVKKILGLVNAELNRQSLHLTIVKAMKLGLLKKNDTAFLNQTLLNHTLPKFKETRNRTRTGINETAAELEEFENEERNMTQNNNHTLKLLKEKIKEKHGLEKKIEESNKSTTIPTKPLPPEVEKEVSESKGGERKGEQKGSQGKQEIGKGK
ncbi:MAG: hypothetical protein ABWK01_04480 [Infirmifilum sp.]